MNNIFNIKISEDRELEKIYEEEFELVALGAADEYVVTESEKFSKFKEILGAI